MGDWSVLVTVTDPTPEEMDRLFVAIADAAYDVMPEPDVSGFPTHELANYVPIIFPDEDETSP